jgi:hypothetical protein
MMKTLHLNLKAEYFDAIKLGVKLYEYRLNNDYWRCRLDTGRHNYDQIAIKKGYPKARDSDRIIVRPWLGYEKQTIEHPHFGNNPVEVFAIRVN